MTTNHKQYESIPSHNVESQALIGDEVIEQGFPPRRRPLMALFLGIALATIAVGFSMVHQTFGAYSVQFNAYDEHIAVLHKKLNEVKSNLENTNGKFATVPGDEFESRDLGVYDPAQGTHSLGVGGQCSYHSSCASGSCIVKPYAFCSGTPTTSPTLTPGTKGSPCDYHLPRGPDCNDGLYCPAPYFNYDKSKYESFCKNKTPNGSSCWSSFECTSHNCNNLKCDQAPPTRAPSPNNPADKGRCGPLVNGRMCDCTGDEQYCNSDNGYCGNTAAHKDAQKGETQWDCFWKT